MRLNSYILCDDFISAKAKVLYLQYLNDVFPNIFFIDKNFFTQYEHDWSSQ